MPTDHDDYNRYGRGVLGVMLTLKTLNTFLKITRYYVRAPLCKVSRLSISARPASQLFGAGNSKTPDTHGPRRMTIDVVHRVYDTYDSVTGAPSRGVLDVTLT